MRSIVSHAANRMYVAIDISSRLCLNVYANVKSNTNTMFEQSPTTTKHQLSAAELLSGIAATPEFSEAQKAYPFARALARTAFIRAGMFPKVKDERRYDAKKLATTPEARVDRMIGTLPQYVEGLEGMRQHFRDTPPQSGEFHAAKHHVIRFNHSLKALLEADENLDAENLVMVITDMYGVMNSDRWGDDKDGWHSEQAWFKQHIDQCVRGMQHEVIASQIITAIGELTDEDGNPIDISVDTNVTIQDEVRGVDMFVTLDGVTFPIDIKASERTAQHARKKSRKPNSIIATGIHTRELGGAFRVSPDKARTLAPSLLEKLRTARNEHLAYLEEQQAAMPVAA